MGKAHPLKRVVCHPISVNARHAISCTVRAPQRRSLSIPSHSQEGIHYLGRGNIYYNSVLPFRFSDQEMYQNMLGGCDNDV